VSIPFVVFDRDGTLIESVHHLVNPNDIRLKPQVFSSLIRLRDAGFRFGMITNQSVIARGLASIKDVTYINKVIMDSFEAVGVTFDFTFLCPHLPTQGCKCRKPGIELGIRAIEEYGLCPNLSYMVGDQVSDIEFAKNLGLYAVQLMSNESKSDFAHFHACTLSEVAEWIIQNREAKVE
jgi:histidinol-phosphate phosphatase family protein